MPYPSSQLYPYAGQFPGEGPAQYAPRAVSEAAPVPPELTSAGQVLYDSVRPDYYDDASTGFSLAYWAGAYGATLQTLWDLVKDDQVTGRVGWSNLFDPDKCPDIGLPFLSTVVGAPVIVGEDQTITRQRIKNHQTWTRCSVPAILAEVALYLVGDGVPYVALSESGYTFEVLIRFDQSPADLNIIHAAIRRQKAIGLTYTLVQITGGDYETLLAHNTTYEGLPVKFTTYEDILTDPAR